MGGGVAFVLLFGVSSAAQQAQFAPFALTGDLVFLGLAVFCLIRFGLLTLVTNYIFYGVMTDFPLTLQGSAWYSGISLAGILLVTAIALYAFYT